MASATLDARDDIHPLTIALTAMGGTLAVTPYMLVRAIEEVWTDRSIVPGAAPPGNHASDRLRRRQMRHGKPHARRNRRRSLSPCWRG